MVARVSDADPGLLRFFAGVGIGLDTAVTVAAQIELGDAAAAAIRLVPRLSADGSRTPTG